MKTDNTFALTEFVSEAPYGKPVGAIHRGFEILELFAVQQVPLTVGEVSEKLGYPQSSTSVLLHGLANLGYLLHDRRARTFFPTVRVTFLGMWLQHRILNHGSVLQFMETLANKSGHVVLLAMQNGLYAQYTHIVSSRSSRVGLKPGLLRPICRAAVGKVLLSTKGDDEIKRIVRNVNAIEAAKAPPISVDELLGEIQECRRTGFAFSCDSVTAGSAVVATLIPVEIAGAAVAIGVGVHSNEFETLRPVMMELLQHTVADYFSDANHVNASDATGPTIQPPYSVLNKS